ncbi:hypothetical protein EXIGLDRAFT_705322 [Exidia glandulosa HHB12029]|uniref:Uncharacterized protein n=1 Tax=Exidia glandulosa HHB12029 TaxID=1314781 RepID=A0A165KLK2_EXIGL|nr:hypothetical protein EXIGLDRAFT_705322 [Exidia glandulosa HHB12029]
MSRSFAMTKKSSWKDPVLTGASLALQIAKEATSDVPIVKQVVGVALNIVELAERAEKNRDAMRMLAEKAATLAQLVDKVVSSRIVDGRLSDLLGHLSVVLAQVQEFMLKETAERNVLRNIYRSIFTVQKRTEELSNALEIEIHGFTTKFRLLRDYEVQKLDVILERETEYGTITFARALVDGISKPMVVRYISEDGPVASTSKQTILTTVSSMDEECVMVKRSSLSFGAVYMLQRIISKMHAMMFAVCMKCFKLETTHPRSIDEGKLKMWMESVISHSPLLRQVWTRVCAEELRIEVEEREELLTDICRMSPDIVPDATSHWNDLYARQYPLARSSSGQSARQTRLQNQEDQVGLTSDGEEESLEVNITCHLVCDTVSSSGHRTSRGLKVWLNCLSDTAFIRRSYLMDFPEEVAADRDDDGSITDSVILNTFPSPRSLAQDLAPAHTTSATQPFTPAHRTQKVDQHLRQ